MDKQNQSRPRGALTSDQQAEEAHPGQCMSRHANTLPRFRGVLLCRRCDSCGTRISFKGEAKDKLILKCPECLKEYTFFERND